MNRQLFRHFCHSRKCTNHYIYCQGSSLIGFHENCDCRKCIPAINSCSKRSSRVMTNNVIFIQSFFDLFKMGLQALHWLIVAPKLLELFYDLSAYIHEYHAVAFPSSSHFARQSSRYSPDVPVHLDVKHLMSLALFESQQLPRNQLQECPNLEETE